MDVRLSLAFRVDWGINLKKKSYTIFMRLYHYFHRLSINFPIMFHLEKCSYLQDSKINCIFAQRFYAINYYYI